MAIIGSLNDGAIASPQQAGKAKQSQQTNPTCNRDVRLRRLAVNSMFFGD
jgi:hypothetical protein